MPGRPMTYAEVMARLDGPRELPRAIREETERMTNDEIKTHPATTAMKAQLEALMADVNATERPFLSMDVAGWINRAVEIALTGAGALLDGQTVVLRSQLAASQAAHARLVAAALRFKTAVETIEDLQGVPDDAAIAEMAEARSDLARLLPRPWDTAATLAACVGEVRT